MHVAVVSTGGTIAMAPDQSDGASPELTGADLVDSVPGLEAVADVSVHDLSNLPSAHFTVETMLDIVEKLRALAADPDVDGVVVTQGTDVMEESAYFLDLCYDGGTPVAFTGAMRNPTLASPDGPANLLASAKTATDPDASGVVVVFNDRVLHARDVVKTNSTNLDTFRSPEFGPLAVVEEDRVTWRRRPVDPDPTFDPPLDPDAFPDAVHAVTVTVDMPPAQIRAAADASALCLAATGAGHVPTTILPALEELREADVPVVATTRCYEGRLLRDTYGFRGSEATLRELGCQFSDLPLPKTRVRTMLALAADRLDDAFDQP